MVYDTQTQSWLWPQKDPYTLENFQQAYKNISLKISNSTFSSDEDSTESQSVRQELAVYEEDKLRATHYAVKIWPRTEEEQRNLELDEDIHVSYTPFDYVLLSEVQTKGLNASTPRATLEDDRRYSFTYEEAMTQLGLIEARTYVLPVLYVAWPCDKPFPAGMDHEILYEVFLPGTASAKSIPLSSEAIATLEQAAIDLVIPPSDDMHSDDIQWGRGKPIGRMQHYDNFLKEKVPLTNLKIKLTLGSSIKMSPISSLINLQRRV